jgi:hypothetical protein
MRFTRSLGIAAALLASAIVGGTLIGSTLATDEGSETDSTTSSEAYCDVFMDALAADLGVTRESLVAAGRSAANAAIDAAIEAGDLSDDRAEALRERIAEADGAGCGWFGRAFARGFGHGFDRGLIRGFVGGNVLSDAAELLGMETAEVLDAVREHGSLEAVAEEQGVAYDDVKSAVLSAAQAELDGAVENGLSQERADAAIERLSEWLEAGGELPAAGRGGWFGPRGGHDGPWTFGDGDSDSDADAEDAGA